MYPLRIRHTISTPFFLRQNMWQMYAEELNRPGNFCTHARRNLNLLFEVLSSQDDVHSLLFLAQHLRNRPEAARQYMRDNERVSMFKKVSSHTTTDSNQNWLVSYYLGSDVYTQSSEGTVSKHYRDETWRSKLMVCMIHVTLASILMLARHNYSTCGVNYYATLWKCSADVYYSVPGKCPWVLKYNSILAYMGAYPGSKFHTFL